MKFMKILTFGLVSLCLTFQSNGEDKSTQILELPYKGNETSMLILLPKTKEGISKLDASLTDENLKNLLKRMRKQKVKVYFPKFKTETKYEMSNPEK